MPLTKNGRITLFTFGVSRPLLFYSKPSSVYVLQRPTASNNRNRNDWKGTKPSPTMSKGKMTKGRPKFRKTKAVKTQYKVEAKGERVMAFFWVWYVQSAQRNRVRQQWKG